VVAFTSRRRGIGYSAIPASRWTYPVSVDGGAALYTAGAEVFYLQPYLAAEYNDRDYALLHEPQATTGRPDGWVWVHLQPLSPTMTAIVGGAAGQAAARVAFQPYYVDQSSGSALGYTIVPYSAGLFSGESPSFSAYRVPAGATGVVTLQLVDASRHAVPGSSLEVHTVHPDAGRALFAPALLPLLVGLSVLLWRDLR
jgi:hypothetical protein